MLESGRERALTGKLIDYGVAVWGLRQPWSRTYSAGFIRHAGFCESGAVRRRRAVAIDTRSDIYSL